MKINKTELLKALEIVKPGLSNKEIVEQASSFAFIGDRIVTYNDEISISHPIDNLDLIGAIKTDEMYKLLSKVKDDEIDIELNKNEIILSYGKSKAGFAIEEEIKLPLDEIEDKGKWKSLNERFIDAVLQVAPVCSKDNSTPLLTCIHISSDFVEGSDGWILFRYMIDSPFKEPVLIPAANAIQIGRIKPTKVSKSDGWLHFKNDEGTIISSRIFADDVYKDFTFLFKKKGEEFTFSKASFAAIEQASIFKINHNEDIHIVLENNNMKIMSESSTGWYEENIRVRYNGETLKFAISPFTLQSTLSKTLNCIICDNLLKFEGENWVCFLLLKIV